MTNQPHIPLRIFAPTLEFVFPYISRELPDYEIIAESAPGQADVAIVTPDHPLAKSLSDKIMHNPDSEKTDDAVPLVLVCPNVVGTGMNGLPMEFVRMIARGSYYHLGGNEARLSTVHAKDVAAAVRLSLGSKGCYLVTDGHNPTYHDFAEALAHRLNHKRILTLNSPWVRWIISPRLKKTITTDQIADGKLFADHFDFRPTPVTEYLRTHIYDDESL